MGTGTIQSMVALSAMQNQWQKKKNDINAGKTSELTSEQRELQMYQSQADDIREGQKPAAIDIKLASGSRLNAEEIEYLKKHNPQALKDYEEEQRVFVFLQKHCLQSLYSKRPEMCNVKKAAAGSNGHTGRTSGICGISPVCNSAG